MFISSCTTIYFFECLYFSEYDIRMSLYVYGLKNGPSIEYVLVGDGGHPKYVQPRTGERGVKPHVYVRTYTVPFHVFGRIFVLYCLVLFVEI